MEIITAVDVINGVHFLSAIKPIIVSVNVFRGKIAVVQRLYNKRGT